jgi:hypothetical protein
MNCECGAPAPCVLHDVTITMHMAMGLLKAMHPEQRSRLLCWFCRDCCEYIGPGKQHICHAETKEAP